MGTAQPVGPHVPVGTGQQPYVNGSQPARELPGMRQQLSNARQHMQFPQNSNNPFLVHVSHQADTNFNARQIPGTNGFIVSREKR